jgi:hypothetical protein
MPAVASNLQHPDFIPDDTINLLIFFSPLSSQITSVSVPPLIYEAKHYTYIKITGKFIFLCILIFTFVDNSREGRRSCNE